MEDGLRAAFEAGDLPGLHAVVATLNGETIGEVYFAGEDGIWGKPLGHVDHGPATLHDVRSITKSVVGLLYGIALDDGMVPPLDSPLLDHFPDYADLKDGSAREDITVRHALTLQMGTEWNEDLPYTSAENSEIAMELAEDRYRFALDRPMVDPPGTKWSYNGGAVALIGKLIEDGAGMTLDAFAAERLFNPLGISQFEWIKGADGVASAASGLRLTARDLTRIGQMVANGGLHEGRQIVPADWLEQSFKPAGVIEGTFTYGFLWYLSTGPDGDTIAIAIGNGGQRLTVQPNFNFVLTTLAGRYNDPEAWKLALDVLLKHAVPEANRRLKSP